jgi:uncharacterized protein with von Willebrand factor type A (vWA) domain
MADPRAPLRVLDELLWVLRRQGLSIATSQAIDAVRAAALVGFESRDVLREALASVVVTRSRDRARFDAGFDAFFARTPRSSLWERLAAKGFADDELGTLRELLAAFAAASGGEGGLAALLTRGPELDRLLQLAGTARVLDAMQSRLQTGFFAHKLLAQVGAPRATKQLEALRLRLADALGSERGDALAAALAQELRAAEDDVRDHVRGLAEVREQAREDADRGGLESKALATLDPVEIEEVRRALRRFVERLRGGDRVRRRRARLGRIDAHRTLRLAMRTGGVPFALARRARRRDKPKLLLVCDVSESVRSVATFLLELAYLAQELFAGTRTFVFVSELAETTRLFDERPIDQALAHAYSGAVVPVTHNSNYGRVLHAFEARVLGDVDRRTTVVVLGDGRTNYLAAGEDVLDAIRARARALVWLCPEPRSAWAVGDSAMSRYAPRCTKVLDVRTPRDLEDAARLLVTLR